MISLVHLVINNHNQPYVHYMPVYLKINQHQLIIDSDVRYVILYYKKLNNLGVSDHVHVHLSHHCHHRC
ncbi:hypothetical protein FRACYDRAFT_273298 [Fragilariopsis cylindrus CCMP1102]|uniref:Uncharacterized protein n=1 Tax=Fragilariopsis cylindrus CCMP1102 TaxID=635003 RepID=A0A1E7EJD9_9STRA|nr:hypothetical protein FRACYDRAFT_273298 [Fragilariopsis cylindrus CCMP1102]|eukprot:OEU06009.1 hypothetical protein FRACYDRAFT_273298 [Fragilariopsis cylindrus CCMP1102]